jgi:hypothetical protein
VGGQGGVCIVLELLRVFEFDFWKTTWRDRVRVFAKLEIPRRVRGTSENQKKRLAEAEASAAIQASIKRSLVPPTALAIVTYTERKGVGESPHIGRVPQY